MYTDSEALVRELNAAGAAVGEVQEMGLREIMLNRRSIRRYTREEIPAETLDRIIEAGLLAPTSRNLKPCEFYVVREPEKLKRLAEAKDYGAAMAADCSAAIVVFGDSSRADTWVEDCSIAMTYMMLKAEEEGIGCCWVQLHLRADASGKDAEENARGILSVPANMRTVGMLVLGMPAEALKPRTPEDADWTKVHR